MKTKQQIQRLFALVIVTLFLSEIAFSQRFENPKPQNLPDTFSVSNRYVHRIGIEARPGYIFPTNDFLRGDNNDGEPIRNAFSAHLKYSFQFTHHSFLDRIYGGAYQGIGAAWYNFGDKKQIGNPLAIYLFQGGRMTRFNPRLTLNYEWNFGVSFGWEPYDYYENFYNKMIGSEVNAYLNTNFYFSWMLNKWLDINAGVTLSHFSNGNTKFPNAGLNAVDLNVGLVWNINRENNCFSLPADYRPIPSFRKHVSYDLVLFGSWRRKGVLSGEDYVAAPDAYPVFGFNFSPMYNFGYKFRAGVSVDGVYDGSANIYVPDYIMYSGGEEFVKPAFNKQLAVGLSGRAEYVMPYFTVSLGLGANVWHNGEDLKGLYQILALKMELTRSCFLHIGYCLQDFHNPNYLMLGIGYRFNNKYPFLHR